MRSQTEGDMEGLPVKKKTTKAPKKLRIHRETLRQLALTPNTLKHVRGATAIEGTCHPSPAICALSDGGGC